MTTDPGGTLLLRLSGPLQSWGISSRFTERDTGLEPSKSGVIGLVCAALGRPREADVSDLAALRMGARIDRAGIVRNDFQSAGAASEAEHVVLADGKRGRGIISNRAYLSDAVFLVGLAGNDLALLHTIDAALAAPRWPLFLGRRGYVPGEPVSLPGGGVRPGRDLTAALCDEPPLAAPRDRNATVMRLVVEIDGDGSRRLDQPIGAAFADRTFGPRYVQSLFVPVARPAAAAEANDVHG
jgi:CRISPR system Cascade subunit CasD